MRKIRQKSCCMKEVNDVDIEKEKNDKEGGRKNRKRGLKTRGKKRMERKSKENWIKEWTEKRIKRSWSEKKRAGERWRWIKKMNSSDE